MFAGDKSINWPITIRRRSLFDASLHSTTVRAPSMSTTHTSIGPPVVGSSSTASASCVTPGTRLGS